MDVPHEPIEYVDIAVDANVDVIYAFGVTEVLFEILHVRDQQIFVTFEVFVHLLVLIADVDDDRFAGGGYWS